MLGETENARVMGHRKYQTKSVISPYKLTRKLLWVIWNCLFKFRHDLGSLGAGRLAAQVNRPLESAVGMLTKEMRIDSLDFRVDEPMEGMRPQDNRI